MTRLLRLGMCGCLVVACNGTQGGAEHPKPFAVPEIECREVPDRATPLVVDWTSQHQVDLTAAMKDGVAVVAYGCDALEVLSDCHIKGGYGYMGVTPRTEVIQLTSADELQANLPSHGPELVAKVTEHGAWDVALVTVGKKRTTLREVKLADLEGDCEGATHFVRGAYIGAYAMNVGKAGQEVAADRVFAGSRHKSGDPKACKAATADSATAPGSCAVAVRLELRGITGVVAKGAGSIDAEGGDCPKGMVMSKGKCTASTAVGHVCKPGDGPGCQAQCDKGNQESCGYLGFLYQYELGGMAKDVNEAGKLYQAACDAGVQYGCAGLGIMYERGHGGFPKNPRKAATLYQNSCEAGVPRGCNNLGAAYGKGNGVPKDKAKALKLYRRACNGGHALACSNLAYWVKNDDKNMIAARGLYEKACDGGSTDGCKGLAFMFKRGEGGRKDLNAAAKLFLHACEDLGKDWGAADSCNELGLMFLRGEHTDKDAYKATTYYERACELGEGWGCSNYFVNSAWGQHGLAKDPERALPLGIRGCHELEHGPCCLNLGNWYKSEGLNADAKAAYGVGCKAGNQSACSKLAQL